MITIMKTGAPTTDTKGLVGQHYIDIDTGAEYECVDVIDHRRYKKGLVKPHDFVSQKVVNGVTCEYIWKLASGEGGGSGLDMSDDSQLEMLIAADLLPAVTTASGAILTDSKGNIILRY